MADVKSGDIVVPGDRLCVIEELSPSDGTYEKEGIVYAATSGGVHIDLKDRSVKVLDHGGIPRIALPIRGDILVGEVANVYEQRAEVSLVKRNDVDVHSPFVGEIHISNVTRRYVKSMHDVIRLGDIIRGMATNTHSIPVQLTLVGPNLGVLLGKCSKCGNPLTLTSHNNLVCLSCENRETREVATDYGQRFGLEPRPDLAPKRRSFDERRYDEDRTGRGRQGYSEGRGRRDGEGYSEGRGRPSPFHERTRGSSYRPSDRRKQDDDGHTRGRRR